VRGDETGEEVRPVQRVHKAEPAAAADRDASAGHPNGPVDDGGRAATTATEIPVRNEPAPEVRHAEPASPRPAEPPHPIAAHPAPVESAARDIRLELGGSGRRVEVRFAERAGEVRVSVRTPDGALADTLRDHLPSLSARLEQSGIRADQWHAGDGFGGTRPVEVQQTAGGGVGEGRQQHTARGDESAPRDQSGRQRDQRGDGQPNRNQKGKDFAWLMSSLG
jgi:hypothetical protein